MMENKHAIAALGALAQALRLEVFRLLVRAGPAGLAASAIADALAVPPSSLSFHLKELSHAELITARQAGRFIIYSANFDTMRALQDFLNNDCCGGTPCGLTP